MFIGKIANSSSHIDYICQVYGAGEAAVLPQPDDYGFGTFVGIEIADGGWLVGVIHNTMLLNPEFGNLGPRLSPQADLAVFSPDYLTEQVTVVAVLVLGSVDTQGRAHQGVPVVAARIGARVRTLTREDVIAFHRAPGGLQVAYVPLLTALQTPLAPHLVEQILAALCALFPAEATRLNVLRNTVAWKSRVQPVG